MLATENSTLCKATFSRVTKAPTAVVLAYKALAPCSLLPAPCWLLLRTSEIDDCVLEFDLEASRQEWLVPFVPVFSADSGARVGLTVDEPGGGPVTVR